MCATLFLQDPVQPTISKSMPSQVCIHFYIDFLKSRALWKCHSKIINWPKKSEVHQNHRDFSWNQDSFSRRGSNLGIVTWPIKLSPTWRFTARPSCEIVLSFLKLHQLIPNNDFSNNSSQSVNNEINSTLFRVFEPVATISKRVSKGFWNGISF